jgi:hypothetical protein
MIGLPWVLLALVVVVGCTPANPTSAPGNQGEALIGSQIDPVEEEQIKNVVTDFFVRDSAAPAYEVTIEEIEQNWARVALAPAASDNSTANLVYLQNQSDTAIEAPTAEAEVNPGNIGPVSTTSGWTIIAGPQASFTDEELDSVGVPPFIRE